jgi:hypothetical protein
MTKTGHVRPPCLRTTDLEFTETRSTPAKLASVAVDLSVTDRHVPPLLSIVFGSAVSVCVGGAPAVAQWARTSLFALLLMVLRARCPFTEGSGRRQPRPPIDMAATPSLTNILLWRSRPCFSIMRTHGNSYFRGPTPLVLAFRVFRASTLSAFDSRSLSSNSGSLVDTTPHSTSHQPYPAFHFPRSSLLSPHIPPPNLPTVSHVPLRPSLLRTNSHHSPLNSTSLPLSLP